MVYKTDKMFFVVENCCIMKQCALANCNSESKSPCSGIILYVFGRLASPGVGKTT
jgi:hypothetical protein